MNEKQAVVLDANIVLQFMLYDALWHSQAAALIEDLVQRGIALCAPSIFAYECDSVLRRQVHLKLISGDEAQEMRQLIGALGVMVSYDASVLDRAWEIAETCGQPRTYDATYAAFAQSRGLDLWTGDKRFYNAVKDRLGFVNYLGNY